MSEVERYRGGGVERQSDIATDLANFEAAVSAQLAAAGLPSENVFVGIEERQTVLSNIGSSLAGLPAQTLERSYYVTKMIAAAAVGLFDAALNYLWDETVSELRRRVAGFDLAYFYDIAAPNEDIRRHLANEGDLVRVDDANLLRAAREIGLLTDVGYERLDHIRYMRNHASAAHPNQVDLSGLDLVNWLQICVRQVILTPPDNITASTGRLLANLKKTRLSQGEIAGAAAFFDELPQDRANTLANGLFGLYVDPRRTAVIADNVRQLWPLLWEFVDEDTRLNYGVRHARYLASVDTDQATAARELIDLVDGTSYLTDQTRAAELDLALDALSQAHTGWNNFYNEAAPARQVAALVGDRDIPGGSAAKYVALLVELFLGNGHGVATAAEPIYRALLENLDPANASRALRQFARPAIASLLRTSSARRQWNQLLDILEPKLTRRSDRALMDAIRAFSGTPDKLASDTAIKQLIKPRRRP